MMNMINFVQHKKLNSWKWFTLRSYRSYNFFFAYLKCLRTRENVSRPCTDSTKWLFLYYGMKTSSRLHGLKYIQTHMQTQTVSWYIMIVISIKISTPALFIRKNASHNNLCFTFCKMHRNIIISKSNNIML